MIFPARLLVVAFAVTMAALASCSSANTPEESSTSSGSPTTSTSPSDACVAPARAALQDQDPDDHQVPWKRNGARKVVITFETSNVPADWVAEMQKGVAAWNESACHDSRNGAWRRPCKPFDRTCTYERRHVR